ncbi:hypothetical protein DPMN_034366 [Dreissena polymorpha]|uniref:Uncharacterized protein n=1 Tax=Dreissena polymorpha TaxID=45954 RepID=A0A9D4RLX0_DREPO|nr:hypothetical protein DPMN_034366 [Dreissena polymorpha]
MSWNDDHQIFLCLKVHPCLFADSLQFRVTLIPLIGEFEVIEGHDIVCSGKIRHLQHPTPDTRKEVGPMSPLKKMELQVSGDLKDASNISSLTYILWLIRLKLSYFRRKPEVLS